MSSIIHVRKASEIDFSGYSLAFGVFDGVHRGHQHLIEQAKADARLAGCHTGVLTFSIDPDELFRPGSLVKLMTNSERIFALADTGVDAVFVLPFDIDFAAKNPDEFLDWTFGSGAPHTLHVGEGFRFGCKGSGTADDLVAWGATHDMLVCEHGLFHMNGARVSSTRIRNLISEGRIAEAFALMGPSPASAQTIRGKQPVELALVS